jgi:hypothetical protein
VIHGRSGLPVTPSAVDLQYLQDTEFLAVPHRGLLFHSLDDAKIRVGLPPVPGTYRVAVTAAGHLTGMSETVEFDGRRSPPPFLVRLERRLRLAGTVRHRGQPVAGVHVQVLGPLAGTASSRLLHGVPAPTLPRPLFGTTTDSDGRFEFTVVPPGTYRLTAACEGYADYLSPPIAVPAGVTGEDYPLTLSKGARLRGRVLREGAVDAGGSDARSGIGVADVPVILLADCALPRTAWTDAGGRYEFSDLPPADDYRLFLGNPSRPAEEADTTRGDGELAPRTARSEAPREVAVSAGEDASCDLLLPAPAFGSLEGRVLVDGAPRSVEVELTPLAPQALPLTSPSDDAGNFFVRGVPPGKYRVRALRLPIEREVEIAAGRRAHVVLEFKALRYTVAVRSAGGERLGTPWTLDLGLAATGTSLVRRVVDQESTAIAGLLPGKYRARLSARGYATLEQLVDLSGDREDLFLLEPGSEVRIRLRTEDGGVFRGEANVEILQQDTAIHRGLYRVDEYLELPALPYGEYILVVRAEGRLSRSRLTIRPGG